jgi:hypothetical protein
MRQAVLCRGKDKQPELDQIEMNSHVFCRASHGVAPWLAKPHFLFEKYNF